MDRNLSTREIQKKVDRLRAEIAYKSAEIGSLQNVCSHGEATGYYRGLFGGVTLRCSFCGHEISSFLMPGASFNDHIAAANRDHPNLPIKWEQNTI